MTSTKLTHEQRVRAEKLLEELCQEYNTTVDKVCAKHMHHDLRYTRKNIYERLRSDMGLTYAKIGEVCNRAEDTISTAFSEDSGGARPSKKVVDKKPVAPVTASTNRAKRVKENTHVRLVTTWLTKEDDNRLRRLLAKHKVGQEDLVRGMIVDALYEAETEEAV